MILAIIGLYIIATVLIVYELIPIVNKWVCAPKITDEEKLSIFEAHVDRHIKYLKEEAMTKQNETIKSTTSGVITTTETESNTGKFSVGEIVKCYAYLKPEKVEIVSLNEEMLSVKSGGSPSYVVHAKTCRKLKKKSPTIRVSKEEFTKAWDKIYATDEEYRSTTHSLIWDELVKMKGGE